jgi:hypothetical protein
MTDERPRQFAPGSRVDDLDLSGVHLHGVNLEGARLTDAYLPGADISGDIEGLRVNGVEIEPLVQAELDRRDPERVILRSVDVAGLRQAWTMLEGLWDRTTERAVRLPDELQRQRVDGEWSFVETLRHLILATDCWLFRAIQLKSRPYHRWGLTWTGVSPQLANLMGVDMTAAPGLSEVLPVRREHQRAVQDQLMRLTDNDLGEVRTPDEPGHPDGAHAVLHCLHVLLNEEWEHHRYAVRDLDVIDPDGGSGQLGATSPP